MDIKSGDVLGEVPVGVEPEGMVVSPDNKYTVATSESDEHGACHRQCDHEADRQRAGR